MSSTSATDQYDLVSSFYGPGAVVGWYLTAFACLVSFSLHPRKRCRDSITADLIAVLTFPTVAATDLITQARSYPKEGITLKQNAASIEASLIVTEIFMAIDVFLFLLAVGFKCVRRECLLATVGLFCFSAKCCVYLSPSVSHAIGQNLDGPCFVNSISISSNVLAALFFYMIWPTDRDRGFTAKALIMIPQLLVPCILVIPFFREAQVNLPSQFWPRIRSRIAHDLMPTSNTSVKELDQAVALLAGASVLGFSLYSTADNYYKAWLSKIRAIAQQQGSELRLV